MANRQKVTEGFAEIGSNRHPGIRATDKGIYLCAANYPRGVSSWKFKRNWRPQTGFFGIESGS